MTNLISGKEAIIALANGEEVESRHPGLDKVWTDAKSLTLVESFLYPTTPREFRLKPKMISINGIEVPAPFEPKFGDKVYFIDCNSPQGYSKDIIGRGCEPEWIQFGAWKSEEEVTQVVEALRQVLGKKP